MAEYDPIAKPYQKNRTLVLSLPEVYTYFKLVGEVTDQSILELGCGEGFYTRILKRKGARQVVGVDISEAMIDLAKLQETKEPLGIEYSVKDVVKLGKVGKFDRVLASFLLNHAQTTEQLLGMCRSIFINLNAGGLFQALNNNLELSPADYFRLEKYGRKQSISEPLVEGTPITVTLFGHEEDAPACSFVDFYLSKASYEWAFRQVGFKEIRWVQPSVAPDTLQEFGQEFWQDYLDFPPLVGIECVK